MVGETRARAATASKGAANGRKDLPMTDTATMTMAETARAFADAFETRTRTGCEHQDCDEHDRPAFVALKDDAPEWMTAAVHEAHGDMLPDDWCYQACSRVADAIAETLEYDGDADPLDIEAETCDALVDVYTANLTAWLASNLARVGYCDEALADMGDDRDMSQVLMSGQYLELTTIYASLVAAILTQVDDA